jgi:hypothetical protein
VVSDARFVIVGGGKGSYVDKLYEKIRRKFPQSPAPVIITGYRGRRFAKAIRYNGNRIIPLARSDNLTDLSS